MTLADQVYHTPIALTSYSLTLSSYFQQQFGIKTAGMDDKCTAMQMLVVYAKDLQEGFADYAEEVWKLYMECWHNLTSSLQVARMMVPHLRFYFNEHILLSHIH